MWAFCTQQNCSIHFRGKVYVADTLVDLLANTLRGNRIEPSDRVLEHLDKTCQQPLNPLVVGQNTIRNQELKPSRWMNCRKTVSGSALVSSASCPAVAEVSVNFLKDIRVYRGE